MKITVKYLINGTTTVGHYTAEKITTQHWSSGKLSIRLWEGDEIVEHVGIRQAEHFHVDRRDVAPSPREDA